MSVLVAGGEGAEAGEGIAWRAAVSEEPHEQAQSHPGSDLSGSAIVGLLTRQQRAASQFFRAGHRRGGRV